MIVNALLMILNLFLMMPHAQNINPKLIIADFKDENIRSKWSVVNDDVMGGVSTSKISAGENNVLIFSGEVSLENNGGFASLRSPIEDFNFSDYEGFLLKIKTDGKVYSLSFRQTKYFTGYNYNQKFQTDKDVWQIVKLPFNDFRLKYFGREVTNPEPPDKSLIKQISILISDKQQGPFKTEIEWIGLY